VLSIDADNQRLSLGLKQLQTGIWKEFFDRHRPGDVVDGKVVRLTNFGAFVELADGIEGLIHVSEFDSAQGGEKLELRAGETYQMKIIRLVPEERKIGLSIRALKKKDERVMDELYHFFLFPGFLLLVIEACIGTHRRVRYPETR
jgi:small subunit ribosomal protein S1